jgi:hypothetical protein
VGSNPTLSAILDDGFEPTDSKWPGSSRAARSDARQRPQAGPEGVSA